MILDDYIVTEETSIIDVMKKIDENATGNIFICKNGVLLAVVTDGDIRRSILNNVDRNVSIGKIANYHPVFVNVKEKKQAKAIMRREAITALPLVNDERKIVDIQFLLKEPLHLKNRIDIPLVIMAGGKGTRLKPYTDILPKPLIPIGNRTITEYIMDYFMQYGCQKFYMIVNYKKNFIKSYFADVEEKRDITFVEEEQFLGTGGGLKLLGAFIQGTFFLTNCDILIEADYGNILMEHRQKKNIITIVCAKKKVIIPYGTVEVTEDGCVQQFTEKPSFEFLTNTGLYVIEPSFLDKIKSGNAVPITDIIIRCMEDGERVGTYLIEEDDWMDMGQLEELEKMKYKLGL